MKLKHFINMLGLNVPDSMYNVSEAYIGTYPYNEIFRMGEMRSGSTIHRVENFTHVFYNCANLWVARSVSMGAILRIKAPKDAVFKVLEEYSKLYDVYHDNYYEDRDDLAARYDYAPPHEASETTSETTYYKITSSGNRPISKEQAEALDTDPSLTKEEVGDFVQNNVYPDYNLLGFYTNGNSAAFFLGTKTEEHATDQLIGGTNSPPFDPIKERNVYGRRIKTRFGSLMSADFVWVHDISTYVYKFDPRLNITQVEQQWYQRAFIEDDVDEHGEVFAHCDISGELCIRDNMVQTYEGDMISLDTYQESHFTCEDCGEVFDNERSHDTERGRVCDICYSPDVFGLLRNYTSNPIQAYGVYTHVDASGVAQLTSDVDYSARHGVRKAVIAADPKKKKKNKTPIFGFEFETEVDCSDSAHDTVKALHEAKLCLACEDASLEQGIEFKTAPIIREAVPDVLKRIFAVLNHSSGVEVNDRCGVHIHVSRDALSEAQIGRIMAFVYHRGNRSFIEAIAGRESSGHYYRFNRPAKDCAKLSRSRGSHGKLSYFSTDRYLALNTTDKNTLEFRLFAGSIDHEEVRIYYQFVIALLDYCKPWVSGVNTPRWREFTDWLLDSKRSKKPYRDLIKKLETTGYIKPKPTKKMKETKKQCA